MKKYKLAAFTALALILSGSPSHAERIKDHTPLNQVTSFYTPRMPSYIEENSLSAENLGFKKADTLKTKLKKINTFVNELVTYKADDPDADIWQTPTQTEKIKTGDCEDYAILKLALIRKLLPKEVKAKLLLVFDRERVAIHMLTVVNSSLILDNQNTELLTPKKADLRYQFLGFVNEK